MLDAWKGTKDGPYMPWPQLSVLMLCRLSEPIALTSVIPYLPEMVETFDVPPSRRGFWVGLVMASYSASQAIVAVIAGRTSDIYGRKYVILGSLTISLITSVMFGLSRSLYTAIISRVLGGFGAGSIGIIRTMVAELVPHRSLQPVAFSLAPLVWSLGSAVGPLIGGNLAKPSEHFPSLFGQNRFLKAFPFALPNLVNAALFTMGIIIGVLMLHETLETRKSRRDIGLVAGKKVYKLLSCQRTRKRRNTAERNDESEPFLDLPDTPTSKSSRFDTENQTPPQSPSSPRLKPPTYREVLTAQSALNLAVYTLLAMHAVGYDALIAIYLHHPVQAHDAPGVNLPFRFSGGLGMDSQGIGFMWTVYAVWGAFIQLVIFPPVARAFGELAVLRASSHAFPIVYLLHPFAAMLPTARGRQLAVLVLMMLKGALSIAAFPCSAILMTNSAASVRVLGLLNGLAVSISAVGRGGGPALAGASFSLGADIQFGMLSWIVLALFGVLAAAPQWWLRQMEGFGDKPEAAKRSSESDGAARPNGNGKAGYEAVQQDGEDELANSNDPSDPFVGSPDRTRRV